MSLKTTAAQLKRLLSQLHTDLEKAEGGNRSACQRVRTGTIYLAKIAKIFRKESIDDQKKDLKRGKK